jgi:hypothetical protein
MIVQLSHFGLASLTRTRVRCSAIRQAVTALHVGTVYTAATLHTWQGALQASCVDPRVD